MRIWFLGILACSILVPSIANADVRIADDRGGRIGTYVDKYDALLKSGETAVVDGLCASACTIVLAKLPRERIRVTSRARFGFHAAWDFDAYGRQVTNPEATNMLYNMYPSSVQRWIARKGGLTPKMVFLSGKQLAGLYGVRTQVSYTGTAYAQQSTPPRVHVVGQMGLESDRASY